MRSTVIVDLVRLAGFGLSLRAKPRGFRRKLSPAPATQSLKIEVCARPEQNCLVMALTQKLHQCLVNTPTAGSQQGCA